MDELAEQQISTSQAAYLLGLSVQRIRRLIAEGHLARLPSGKMDLVGTVRAYVKFLRDDARRSTKSSAMARVQEARAKLLELDYLTREGRLMDVQEGIDMYSELVGSLKSRVYAVPARATSDPAQRRAIEKLLDEAFDSTVQALAGAAEARAS